MQTCRCQERNPIGIGIFYLFAGEPMSECLQKQRLTVLMTSFSVATSTTTEKFGGSCSLSLSVATRNSAEPGKMIAAFGDN